MIDSGTVHIRKCTGQLRIVGGREMYRIFCIMGKSSSGKDTLYRELLRDSALQLQKVVMYTTRPPRDKEVDGREYYFTSEPMFHAMCKAGKVIEHRVYETVQGPWYYYTADDGQIDLGKHNYLIIGTLDVYTALRDHFGPAHVVPILMEVDDGERLSRALRRERRQKHPQYEEMCRRFLADQADFSEEKIRAAGIRRRFSNASIDICKEEVRRFIAGSEASTGERGRQGESAGQGENRRQGENKRQGENTRQRESGKKRKWQQHNKTGHTDSRRSADIGQKNAAESQHNWGKHTDRKQSFGLQKGNEIKSQQTQSKETIPHKSAKSSYRRNYRNKNTIKRKEEQHG